MTRSSEPFWMLKREELIRKWWSHTYLSMACYMLKWTKSVSNSRAIGGLCLSISLKALKRGNQAKGGTRIHHLSTIFCALELGESVTKPFKIKRPHLSETLLVLKRGMHVKPKPTTNYKNLICKWRRILTRFETTILWERTPFKGLLAWFITLWMIDFGIYNQVISN